MIWNGTEFNDELMEEIATVVGKATDLAVLGYLKSNTQLTNGFQLKKSSCGGFRKKITAHIRAMKELDDEAAEFLYEAGLGQTFVVVLSVLALDLLGKEFSIILGRPGFILALLLDKRPDVNRIGRRLLNEPEDSRTPEDARTIVADTMSRFASLYLPICTSGAAAGCDNNGHLARLMKELEKDLKAEQRRNEEIGNRLQAERDSFSRQIAEKNLRIDKLVAERAEIQAQFIATRREADTLFRQLEQGRHDLEATIAEGVKARLKGITSTWLAKRVTVEQELGTPAELDDILAEADAALVLQEQADRHTGNRKQLRQRLEAITAKLAEVREARANALHPIDALTGIELRLGEEERHLAGLLGPDTGNTPSPLAQAIAARISSASGDADLHYHEELLDELRQLGLPSTDQCYLQRHLSERYDRLVAVHCDDKIPVKPLNPALRLRTALSQGKSVMLVCDGHNMLNCMEHFRDVRNRSHSEARQRLSESIDNLLRPYLECSASIVYDGTDHNSEAISDKVTVIYSGGGKHEKHRADRRIEELLNWRSYTSNNNQIYVVTSDNELGREARDRGAEVIALEQFGWVLGA